MGRKDKNVQAAGTLQMGPRMRSARQSKSLALKEMARRIQYGVTYLSAIENGNGRPSRSLVELYERELELAPGELTRTLEDVEKEGVSISGESVFAGSRSSVDWGEVPDGPDFYGREKELAELSQWIVDDKCRIVLVQGIGGVGKTSLAAKLAHQTQHDFEYIFWRSLQSMPPLEHILKQCIPFLSENKMIDVPQHVDDQISMLIARLRERRCLLILDNFESVLVGSSRVGQYREGYGDYGRLLQRIGVSDHKSCLLLTSREKPKEVVNLEGTPSLARSFQLLGIGYSEARKILKEKQLIGSDEEWSRLIYLYSGNPLSLKLIAEPIREVFSRDIAAFLREGETVFGDIYDLLAQQLHRLSRWEQEVLYWLAIEQEALSPQELRNNILHPIPKGVLLEALDSLQRRSMIETSEVERFTLHPVVMEYITSELVERAYQDIVEGRSETLSNYPLIKAQSKDYVRNTQKRLILEPLGSYLLRAFGPRGSEGKLRAFVAQLHDTSSEVPGYTAGNLLNLLVQLQVDLRGWDFSSLVVNQAYLRGVRLPEVSFIHADLSSTVFTETFGSILSVAFSVDGQLQAAGTVTGEIRTWRVSDNIAAMTFQGHKNWVWSVVFSPVGRLLASGSDDRTVRIWEINTGRCRDILEGHTDRVRSVVFSPDGRLLASGSEDGTVRLWEVSTGECVSILRGQGGQVYAVAFSPDGRLLASGSEDGTVRLWEASSGQHLVSHKHQDNRIYAVAFSPDGRLLASGSEDGTVRLWEVSTGECVSILRGQGGQVYAVAFSPDGRLLASGSEDGTVRLWKVGADQGPTFLQGHSSRIYTLAFNTAPLLLASGSNDQTVRLWNSDTGQCLDTLQGYTNLVWSVAFSPDERIVASGSNDRTVRLWNIDTGVCVGTLQGHNGRVRSVSFSPNGRLLASGSEDQIVRIWERTTGQCFLVLEGHSDQVRSVVFSPDGSVLASGSEDGTVRIWEVSTGECLDILEGGGNQIYAAVFSLDGELLATGCEDGSVRVWEVKTKRWRDPLRGHTNKIYAVAFSPDGRMVASGSNDQTVKLWDITDGQCLATFNEHKNRIYAVAFSPDGRMVASGSNDQTVKLWDVSARQCFATLEGKDIWVYSIAFSPDGRILASGGNDGTIELWDVREQRQLKPLKSERPYEGMNITGAKGLTQTQRDMLKTLGAIETMESKILDR